jgi:predicted DNA-binding transcriptional regulator YafY
MRDLRTTNAPFTKVHDAPEIILKKSDKTDSRQYTDVLVKCKERARSRVQEYLKGTAIEKLPDGDTLMKLIIVENEQLWIGTLLSLGDDVEVMEPKEIRQRLVAAAHKIISLYK